MVQLLHGVTFAMAHIAAIQYIQSEEQNRMVALQALYNTRFHWNCIYCSDDNSEWLGL